MEIMFDICFLKSRLLEIVMAFGSSALLKSEECLRLDLLLLTVREIYRCLTLSFPWWF